MLVQVNTDHHIPGSENLEEWVTSDLEKALKRFDSQITRVEVHFNDENGDKSGSHDKKCLLEARIKGLEPVVVSHHAATLHEALKGASDKMVRTLDKTFSKRGHIKGQDPFEQTSAS